MEVLGAQVLEDVDVGPVGRGGSVIEQSGGGEDQRAGAYGHDDLGGGGGGGDVVDQPLVPARFQGGLAAARDDDREGRWGVVEGVAGGELDDGVGGDDVAAFADDEDLEPDPALVSLLEPRLKTGILAVYRIAFAAAPGKPFSSSLKEASARFGWPLLATTDNSAFVATPSALLPGVARLAPGPSAADTLAIRVEPETPGPHVVVLGGRRLDRRAPVVRIDGRPVDGVRRAGNWATFEVELGAGAHTLELPSLESRVDPEADYLYFVAVGSRDRAASYFAMPQLAGPPREER